MPQGTMLIASRGIFPPCAWQLLDCAEASNRVHLHMVCQMHRDWPSFEGPQQRGLACVMCHVPGTSVARRKLAFSSCTRSPSRASLTAGMGYVACSRSTDTDMPITLAICTKSRTLAAVKGLLEEHHLAMCRRQRSFVQLLSSQILLRVHQCKQAITCRRKDVVQLTQAVPAVPDSQTCNQRTSPSASPSGSAAGWAAAYRCGL